MKEHNYHFQDNYSSHHTKLEFISKFKENESVQPKTGTSLSHITITTMVVHECIHYTSIVIWS